MLPKICFLYSLNIHTLKSLFLYNPKPNFSVKLSACQINLSKILYPKSLMYMVKIASPGALYKDRF